jgi:transcription elongation factor Elf1
MDKIHLNPQPKAAEKFRCPKEDCGQKLMYQKTFDEHMQRHEDQLVSFVFLQVFLIFSFTFLYFQAPTWCEGCQKDFKILKVYLRHLELHKGANTLTLTCPTCHKQYKNINILKIHIAQCHTDKPKDFVCETCGVRYTSNTELQSHIQRKHDNYRPFECHHCGKGWQTKQQVRIHIISMHTKLGYTTCNICGAQVVSPSHSNVFKFLKINFIFRKI